jgi:hypothetical protein
MTLASSTHNDRLPPSNKDLLSSARATLASVSEALERLEQTQSKCEALIAHIHSLVAVDSSQLPTHFNKRLASAQFVPPSSVAEEIRDRALDNLQQALATLLGSVTPHIHAVHEHLKSVSAQSAGGSSDQIEQGLKSGERLSQLLSALSSDPASFEVSTECTTELKKFSSVSRRFSNAIGRENLATIAKQFSEHLDAHDNYLREAHHASQSALLPPSHSELYRNLLLAVDVYELERNTKQEIPARHSRHSGDHNENINSLYRSLPAAHSIDIQALSKALTAIIGEQTLADTIAHTLVEKATWYQLEYPLVQHMLQLKPDQMDLLLTHWSLGELREFAHVSSELKIPAKLASQALLNEPRHITHPDMALAWLQEITTYFSQLSPLERYLPRISPHVSPELFIRHDCLEVAQAWLTRVRDGTIDKRALGRIAAENSISRLLIPFLEHATSAAPTLVYGFGSHTSPREADPSPMSLTGPLLQRRKDLRMLEMTLMSAETGIDLDRTTACSELQKRGLVKCEWPPNSPRKLNVDNFAEMTTKLVQDKQTALPPQIWEHTLAILDALHQPVETMHNLLQQIDSLLTAYTPQVSTGNTVEHRMKITASPEQAHTLISEISAKFEQLSRTDKPHEIKKKIDQITTSFTKLKRLISQSTSPIEPAVEDLLNQIKISPRLSPDQVDEKKSTARLALTAISNLFMDPVGGEKI